MYYIALTFVQVFTNVETAQAYQNLFEDLFGCIKRDTGEPFNFYHIHQKGLGCIIADQHKGQALGKFIIALTKIIIFNIIKKQYCNSNRPKSIFKFKVSAINTNRTFTTYL